MTKYHQGINKQIIVSIHTPTKGVTYISPYLTTQQASFNPHTHEGCDQASSAKVEGRRVFQSTHPRRVWQMCALNMMIHGMFQSTHPRRVWLFLGSDAVIKVNVSIHTPTKGVTANAIGSLSFPFGFNPHTHEGWDITIRSWITWILRFNPHTHEGCDFKFLIKGMALLCFNPHTHEGCDTDERFYQAVIKVSIHTPTKGVTDKAFSSVSLHKFQSTHPRRVWLSFTTLICLLLMFQSTHPRRVWLITIFNRFT